MYIKKALNFQRLFVVYARLTICSDKRITRSIKFFMWSNKIVSKSSLARTRTWI